MLGVEVLLSTTCLFGFFVSGILLFSNKHNRLSNRFLGLLFFTVSFRSLSIILDRNGLVGDNFALGLVSFVYYWIPPLIYLYIRTLAYDQQKLRKSDYLHFIIPILAFGLLLYYLSAGFIYKGRLIFPSREILSGIPSIIYVPATYHAIFICLMAICYAVACWSVVLKKFTRENLQHPQSRKIRNWILTLLIPTSLLTFIVSVSGVLWLLGYVQVTSELYYYQIIRAMLLIFVFSNVLINTELLFGLPDIKTILPPVKTQVVNRIIIPDSVQDKNISSLKEVVASESGNHLYDEFGWIKYSTDYEENDSAEAGVPIENDRAITYINEINEYLKTNPYTDPEFNMQSMSTALSIPVYHLEYLFRYYNKYSFATFRNIMRVQYVLNCFQNGMGNQFTLEAIGQRAGFTSRTNFFRVFKAITGTSPKSHLQSMVEEKAEN